MSKRHEFKSSEVREKVAYIVSLPEWETGFLPFLDEVELAVLQLLKRTDLSERDTAVARGNCEQIQMLRELRGSLRMKK